MATRLARGKGSATGTRGARPFMFLSWCGHNSTNSTGFPGHEIEKNENNNNNRSCNPFIFGGALHLPTGMRLSFWFNTSSSQTAGSV